MKILGLDSHWVIEGDGAQRRLTDYGYRIGARRQTVARDGSRLDWVRMDYRTPTRGGNARDIGARHEREYLD